LRYGDVSGVDLTCRGGGKGDCRLWRGGDLARKTPTPPRAKFRKKAPSSRGEGERDSYVGGEGLPIGNAAGKVTKCIENLLRGERGHTPFHHSERRDRISDLVRYGEAPTRKLLLPTPLSRGKEKESNIDGQLNEKGGRLFYVPSR